MTRPARETAAQRDERQLKSSQAWFYLGQDGSILHSAQIGEQRCMARLTGAIGARILNRLSRRAKGSR